MDTAPVQNPAGGQPAKPNTKLLLIIVGAVIGLSVLGWIGKMVMGKVVGFGVRKAIEAGTGVKVDGDGNTISFGTKDGRVTVDSADENGGTVTFKGTDGKQVTIETQENAKTLPKGFPSDFPTPDGDIGSASVMSAETGSTFTVQWTTPKSGDAVSTGLEESLKAAGWRITMSSNSNGEYFTTFERGPEDAATKDGGWYTIAPKDGTTEISLFLTINKAQ